MRRSQPTWSKARETERMSLASTRSPIYHNRAARGWMLTFSALALVLLPSCGQKAPPVNLSGNWTDGIVRSPLRTIHRPAP